jgi:hypothetical protein
MRELLPAVIFVRRAEVVLQPLLGVHGCVVDLVFGVHHVVVNRRLRSGPVRGADVAANPMLGMHGRVVDRVLRVQRGMMDLMLVVHYLVVGRIVVGLRRAEDQDRKNCGQTRCRQIHGQQ